MTESLECIDRAERLNADCRCASLDRERLRAELEREAPGFYAEVMEGRPHLFSDSLVFVSRAHIGRMAHLVAAVERIAALPAYRERVLSYAPAAARHVPAAAGVFLGYDFHLGPTGPQLIEINTNAGGGLLNAVLARAQEACCDAAGALLPGLLAGDTPEHLFLEMFRAEWRAERGDEPLKAVAIVDDGPREQYLYPEFVLFQRLLEREGIQAVICDPGELMLCHGRLWHGETRIDLVYNRLTDFALEEPRHAGLLAAWLSGGTVLTPHPHAHALFADKRNLALLTDDALLASWGVDRPTRSLLLAAIPKTELVLPELADDYWGRRRQLFFKPAAGFGSRAAYRGAVQLVAARLYQGQTTNFRTPGGGFASVLSVPCAQETPE